MTTTVAVKDPQEEVTVLFDFSSATESVVAPTVTAVVKWNATETTPDPTPGAILFGSPQISVDNPAHVLHKVVGGLHLHDYGLRCVAEAENGDDLLVVMILPVRSLP